MDLAVMVDDAVAKAKERDRAAEAAARAKLVEERVAELRALEDHVWGQLARLNDVEHAPGSPELTAAYKRSSFLTVGGTFAEVRMKGHPRCPIGMSVALFTSKLVGEDGPSVDLRFDPSPEVVMNASTPDGVKFVARIGAFWDEDEMYRFLRKIAEVLATWLVSD